MLVIIVLPRRIKIRIFSPSLLVRRILLPRIIWITSLIKLSTTPFGTFELLIHIVIPAFALRVVPFPHFLLLFLLSLSLLLHLSKVFFLFFPSSILVFLLSFILFLSLSILVGSVLCVFPLLVKIVEWVFVHLVTLLVLVVPFSSRVSIILLR